MYQPMINHDHIFDGTSEFPGMIRGNATVAPGAELVLTGMVGGDLIVLEGARVVVTGMINGRIINKGGTVGWRD